MEVLANDTEEDWKRNLKEGMLPRKFKLTPELLVQLGVEQNSTADVFSRLCKANITLWEDLLTFRDQESLLRVVGKASASKIWEVLDKYKYRRRISFVARMFCFEPLKRRRTDLQEHRNLGCRRSSESGFVRTYYVP